jgi:DNA gyrase/topoisomerase IV subunit B
VAVAGFATRIEVTLEAGNRLTVADNGRGMPVEAHPRFPGKSALEVIMTTLPGQYGDRQPVKDLVERLMGRDPARRFEFIQARASAV